jgi:hypothetical protein
LAAEAHNQTHNAIEEMKHEVDVCEIKKMDENAG